MAFTGAHVFNGEDKLNDLVQDIDRHLQNISSRRINRWLGSRSRVYKYQKSWIQVNIALSSFVHDPKRYYLSTMTTIEREMNKFPPYSSYHHHLQKLAHLLAQGPSFSKEYQCQIKMPEKFK